MSTKVAGDWRSLSLVGKMGAYLSCIRFDEVLVLQGAPIIGIAVGVDWLSAKAVNGAALAIIASVLLVAHAFVVNDLAGWTSDQRDPARQSRSIGSRGLTETQVRNFSFLLLVGAAALSAAMGWATFGLCAAISISSFLYSGRWFFWKGVPVAGTFLHLASGGMHFLFGFAAVHPPDIRGVCISVFFGLVFAAGHLTHEVRDRGVDELNAIRTNAVVFGSHKVFVAGVTLFALALSWLEALSVLGILPRAVLWTIIALPLQVALGLWVLRSNLSRDTMRLYQIVYRVEFAALGIAIIVSPYIT